jgi:hypothetical protein
MQAMACIKVGGGDTPVASAVHACIWLASASWPVGAAPYRLTEPEGENMIRFLNGEERAEGGER